MIVRPAVGTFQTWIWFLSWLFHHSKLRNLFIQEYLCFTVRSTTRDSACVIAGKVLKESTKGCDFKLHVSRNDLSYNSEKLLTLPLLTCVRKAVN
jgi:hypothetical protein